MYGVGAGRQGNSYAIPTKDKNIKTLPLDEIEDYVKSFIKYTLRHSDTKFYITRVGCGLAGYNNQQIAPMFKGIQSNCRVHEDWLEYLK